MRRDSHLAPRSSTRRARRLGVVGLALALVLGLGFDAAFAGAGRTRPGGSGSGSGSGSGRASGGGSGGHAGGGGGSAPQHAAGRATYGYGGHHGGYYPPYYHDPYYWGHWGYPYFYGYAGWPWGWWYGATPYYAAWRDVDAPGAVETDVEPKKADVMMDGSFIGQARDYNGRFDILWVEPGVHVFEFVKDGYMTLRRYVEVRGGMAVRIAETLQKGEGIDPRSTEAPPPEPKSETASREYSPPPPRADRGTLERGLLRLGVAPPDAAVYLDGEFLARADELASLHGALPVARGRHTVEVVRPGYASHSIEVDVTGDEPVRLEIALERE